jgi:hypothetical protein
MNKVDLILEASKLTYKKYEEIQASLRAEFKTSHYQGKLFCVGLNGDSVVFPDSCPMGRTEALRMAHWLIDMLGEQP